MNICHNERSFRIRLNQGHLDNRLPIESPKFNSKKYRVENFKKFHDVESITITVQCYRQTTESFNPNR